MKMSEVTHEARNVLGRANIGSQEIGDAKQALERLADSLETLAAEGADPDVLNGCRVILARRALELSQITVARLDGLAADMLRVAESKAVVVACSAIDKHEGTDREGKPFAPTPSEYTLPSEYASAVDKIADKLKSAGTAAATVISSACLGDEFSPVASGAGASFAGENGVGLTPFPSNPERARSCSVGLFCTPPPPTRAPAAC